MSTVKKSELIIDEAMGVMVSSAKELYNISSKLENILYMNNIDDLAAFKRSINKIAGLSSKIYKQGERIHNAYEIGSMKQMTFDAFANLDKPCWILPENRDFFTHNGKLGFYPNENGEEDHSDLRTLGRRRLTPYNSGEEIFHSLCQDVIKEIESGKDVYLVRKDYANRKIVCPLGKKNGSGEANFICVFNSCPNSPTYKMVPQQPDRCYKLQDLLLFTLTYQKFLYPNMITGRWIVWDNKDSRLHRRLVWAHTKEIVTAKDIKQNEVILPEPYEDAYVSLKEKHDKAKENDEFYNNQEFRNFFLGFCKEIKKFNI